MPRLSRVLLISNFLSLLSPLSCMMSSSMATSSSSSTAIFFSNDSIAFSCDLMLPSRSRSRSSPCFSCITNRSLSCSSSIRCSSRSAWAPLRLDAKSFLRSTSSFSFFGSSSCSARTLSPTALLLFFHAAPSPSSDAGYIPTASCSSLTEASSAKVWASRLLSFLASRSNRPPRKPDDDASLRCLIDDTSSDLASMPRMRDSIRDTSSGPRSASSCSDASSAATSARCASCHL
mmetsp:Transcript_12025/g.27418  ORF Transcript_12025/g.27418 Transcript_12025/m.27418 type:complete len:233 (+) Transcript_12025:418-1116(+)